MKTKPARKPKSFMISFRVDVRGVPPFERRSQGIVMFLLGSAR